MPFADKRDLKRLMSEKKGFTARNEKKIESRFAKYPFGYNEWVKGSHFLFIWVLVTYSTICLYRVYISHAPVRPVAKVSWNAAELSSELFEFRHLQLVLL